MPEHTDLSITANGLVCLRQCFVHRKILVIGSHDLCRTSVLMVKTDKVLQDIYESLFLEDAIKEGLVVSKRSRFHRSVHALPFHVTVLLGGNGTCL